VQTSPREGGHGIIVRPRSDYPQSDEHQDGYSLWFQEGIICCIYSFSRKKFLS
jgi:hypothetical protein